MSVQAIKKITKEDIQKLNNENAIYKTKNDMDNGNSTNINIDFFGDGQDIYIDDQGRIIEKQGNDTQVYMGWADKNKLDNKQVNINSAYDYFNAFPEKNNNNLVSGKLNKPSGNTFNSNNTISDIKVYKAPIEVDRSAVDGNKVNSFQKALDNVAKNINETFNFDKTRVYDAPIEVDRSAIDNKTRVYDAPIQVDRSAIDNKSNNTITNFHDAINTIRTNIDENYNSTRVYSAPIEVDKSAIDNKTRVYEAPIEVDRSAIDNIPKTNTNTTIPQKNEDIKPIEKQNIEPIKKEEVKPEPIKESMPVEAEQPITNETENIETMDNIEETPTIDQTFMEPTYEETYEDKYTIQAKNVLQGINEIRRSNGLPDLIWSESLKQAATIRATEASQMWSHTRPNGQQYNSVSDEVKGENLAKNYPDANTTIEAWMNSDSHRANLLDKDLRTVGIAVIETENGEIYYAADFGENI